MNTEEKIKAHEEGSAGPPELADVEKKTKKKVKKKSKKEMGSLIGETSPTFSVGKPMSLEDRLLAIEASIADLKTKVGLPRMMTDEEISAARARQEQLDEHDKLVAAEREFRMNVKRGGGYRKGLSEAEKKRANELRSTLKRKALAWDLELIPAHV